MGTGDLEPWVVECDKVALRGTPSVNGKLISLLTRGDRIIAAELVNVKNEEWVRLPKGTAVARDKEQTPARLEMQEDAFIQVSHPMLGTAVRKKEGVAVQEEEQEGFLSKELMQRILAKSSNAKELVVPLEARTWSAKEFELFVMSGGVVRPKWCSVPDMSDMVNNHMKDHEVESALRQAASWLAGADAVLVGSGAGMGVDSGLSTFRGGKAGVWPALEVVGLAYEEICDPKWFKKEPALAWAFWNFCHEAYQATKPHKGYGLVRSWAAKAPLGAFSFTSNIDSHWAASGWWKRRIIEVHGSVAWHQCAQGCCPDVWEAKADLGLVESPENHRVLGELPKCPKCGGVARPCVQMFGGDRGFAKSRRAVQINRYDSWLKKLEARPDAQELRLVCLELGCGLTVPTVRRELESVLGRFKNARLVRVNPENPGLSKELQDVGLSLPLAAGEALASLEPQVSELLAAEKELAHFVVWDEQGGGLEFTAPRNAPMMRLLRLAEGEEGVEVEFTGEPGFFTANLIQLNVKTELKPDDRMPKTFFWSLRKSSEAAGAEEDESEPVKTTVVSCRGVVFKNGMNQRLAGRVEEVSNMLEEMNMLFQSKEYQDELKTKVDRRGVLQLVRSVHLQVLPKFGISANDSGVWLMQALTGLAMAGRIEIAGKANYSMDVSGINWANTLPVVVKVEKPKPQEPEKPPPPPPEPLEVTLVQLTEEKPASLRIDAMTDTTVAELREKLGLRLELKEAKLKQVKFLMKTTNQYATLKEHEAVRREVFVVGLDRWTHPDEEAPQEVEVSIRSAVDEEDEVRLAFLSNQTLGQAREALFQHLGKPALAKKTKFARKTGNSFCGLEDSDRLGGRKQLFVMGLESERLQAARPAAGEKAPGPSPPSGERREAPSKEGPPDLSLEDAIRLQRDLLTGFGEADFQKKLTEINRQFLTGQFSDRKANVERNKLFLTVQKEVLPRHGFQGNQKGVFDMMTIFGKGVFEHSEEFGKLGMALNDLLYGNFDRLQREMEKQHGEQLKGQSSSSSSSTRPAPKTVDVQVRSADTKDLVVPVRMLATETIYNLKNKLMDMAIDWAHYYTYMRKLKDGTLQELKDQDPVEEVVWAHDDRMEYLPEHLPPSQRLRPPGGTPSRPLPTGPLGRWPAGSLLYRKLEEIKIVNWPFFYWMQASFQTMEAREASAWLALDEARRWQHFLCMVTSPLFAKCRTDEHYAKSVFTLPNFKAPWRYADADPELGKAGSRELLARWFAEPGGGQAAAAGPPELFLISVVRLGEEELVKWDTALPKGATVAELRAKLVKALGLEEKAAGRLRFAMQRAAGGFMSMGDEEKLRKAMAVRGLEGAWPPPADPAARGLLAAA